MAPQTHNTTLNPQAPPFFPHGYVVVSTHYHHLAVFPPPLPSLPPPPPPFFSYQEVEQSHRHEVAEETDDFQKKKQAEAVEEVKVLEYPKWVSHPKQRFLMRAIIRRRKEARRGKECRPLPWVRRADGNGGAYHREVQVEGLESFRALPRKKNHHHPLLPLRSDGTDTTIMIKNVPNKYSREMLVEYLDNFCLAENKDNKDEQIDEPSHVAAFDIVYLPIDFKSNMNKGYAFVNFINSNGAWKFHLANSNQKWDFFHSHKICDVVAARLQGKEKLESHLDSMCFPCGREEVLPVCFSPPRDGTIKGSRRTLGKINNHSQHK